MILTAVTSLILTMWVILSTPNSIILGLMIMSQALLYCTLLSYTTYFNWTAYLLFISILGGILIVFLYVLLSTCDYSISGSIWKLYVYPIIVILIYYLTETLYMECLESKTVLEIVVSINSEEFLKIKEVHSTPSSKISIFFMNWLFFVMILVVFLTKKKGSKSKGS